MWKRVKVGVQGRVARFRIPGGAEPAPADGGRQPDDPGFDVRPMPIAASILWKPIDAPSEPDAGLIPVFITQRALAAVHDHCAATRETCFGLLTGNPYRAPETDLPYVVVESTIRLPGVIGDDAKAALMQGWVVAEDVVHRTGDQLVGWYRGRWSAETGLAPAEAETQPPCSATPGSSRWWWARAKPRSVACCAAPRVPTGRRSACPSTSWSSPHPSERTAASQRVCVGTTTAPKRRRSFRPPRYLSPSRPRRPHSRRHGSLPRLSSDGRRRQPRRRCFCPTNSTAAPTTAEPGRRALW